MYHPLWEGNERGSALMAVIISALVVSTAAAAMLTMSVNTQRQTHHHIERARARLAAEAAHHRVHQMLFDDPTWGNPGGVPDCSPGAGGCTLCIPGHLAPCAAGSMPITVIKDTGTNPVTLRFTTPDYDAF